MFRIELEGLQTRARKSILYELENNGPGTTVTQVSSKSKKRKKKNEKKTTLRS